MVQTTSTPANSSEYTPDAKFVPIIPQRFAGSKHPFDDFLWEIRTAHIENGEGKVIFHADNVEVPQFWSQNALNIFASKYFRGINGDSEHSVRDVILRVVEFIGRRGESQGTLAAVERQMFEKELAYILVHQYASFNSPVWFNCGVVKDPQVSACFINSVEDNLPSILELAKTEGMLFKYGSGTGTNFSNIRGSNEGLSDGGKSSGPVSFMRGFDAFAGVIKSGGKTRRAAKMCILDVDHPDIEEFISCKAEEEYKAQALIDAGYDGSFDGEAYDSVSFQNSNNSVRVSDDFMRSADENRDFELKNRTGGSAGKVNARDLLMKVAESTHVCGDPGMQFHDTINEWHTCPAEGDITASNPCSEFMFLNNSACNLASINLVRFVGHDGALDLNRLAHTVRVMITAQDILVDAAGYPTEEIAENSRNYRPLGLGYTNLGTLLMSKGLAYDSQMGRRMGAGITAFITGHAYLTSAVLAAKLSPFPKYKENREHMLTVIDKHHAALMQWEEVDEMAGSALYQALEIGRKVGFRNSQVTLLAPTGTISFIMDCDTTGIEPEVALVKYKSLSGGGVMKLANGAVKGALKNSLGYSSGDVNSILEHIDKLGTIEGSALKDQHLPVFDCSMKPENGERVISPRGHIDMVAAVQPFLSGAVSKTVNLPEDTTAQEIFDLYVYAWKAGLKSVAFYRDNSKGTQPLRTSQEKTPQEPNTEHREPMPTEREAIIHKFTLGGHEGYITAGKYPDGRLGEVFVTMSKQGSTVNGLMDQLAIVLSVALQHGVPAELMLGKLEHTRFEPAGFTGNSKIPMASSITDYLSKWLRMKFLEEEEESTTPGPEITKGRPQMSSPLCTNCGGLTVRSGSCYHCPNCGTSSGGCS